MTKNRKRAGWRDRTAIGAALALALLASGCSGGSNLFGGPSASAPATTATPVSSSSGGGFLRDDVASFFSGSSDKSPQPVAGAASPDVDCPYIQIREGASTLTINGAGDNAAMSLKYQGTFVRAARQCAVVAGQMVMKIGVQGRLVLGPQGGPGEVNVPLRIAVVDEKPASSKTVVTKLIMIPVVVRSADDNPSFTHVEDNVTFPLPSSSELDNYIVYIGFDPIGAQPQEKRRAPRPKAKRRPAPRAQAAPPLRTN